MKAYSTVEGERRRNAQRKSAARKACRKTEKRYKTGERMRVKNLIRNAMSQ